jgi:hypothetical protein
MKYLVIGSAPYIKDWYAVNGQKYLDAGYKLVAINNAWIIDPDHLHFWVHSSDFYKVGKVIPDENMKRKLDSPERISGIGGLDIYHYDKQGSGTMILNVLTGLINRARLKNTNLEVCCAGCDCIYNGEQNHFYGKGTADSLRFGTEYLVNELNRIKNFYEKDKCSIFNVGGQEETLLPFARKQL